MVSPIIVRKSRSSRKKGAQELFPIKVKFSYLPPSNSKTAHPQGKEQERKGNATNFLAFRQQYLR